MPQSKTHHDTKVLSLGLPRTGSASIASALKILGFNGVCHGVDLLDSKHPWKVLDRAADASFKTLPTYNGRVFTREEWDEVFGPYEALTDLASLFAPQLIQTYPDAKVILVEREFNAWFKSIDEGILQVLWSSLLDTSIKYAEPFFGSGVGSTSRKLLLGMFEAANLDELRKNARTTYDRHHVSIKKMVSPENLLLYELGSGWEPLCEFLCCPIPDAAFPKVNERELLRQMIFGKFRSILNQAIGSILLLIAICIVMIGVWIYR